MDEKATIPVGTAYRAMFSFLEAYWERGGKTDEGIASLLGSMSCAQQKGLPLPLDPAQWTDWLDAVTSVNK